MNGELSARCGAKKVGSIRVEPLLHEQVDLAEIDQAEVERDLFSLLGLGHNTILPPSHGMVKRQDSTCD
jgi:hypothetical protein